ncbi:MAG TPA: MipA/OmpV family protein, partial [Thermodesulfobacteriota bacterium]|nr:MipA/OmpV family protein [Thermodesulfobacteriota bacterium]
MGFANKTILLFLVFILSSGFFPEKSVSGQYPLWEAAMGLVGFSFPDYRGSDETRFYALPF